MPVSDVWSLLPVLIQPQVLCLEAFPLLLDGCLLAFILLIPKDSNFDVFNTQLL